MREEVPDFPPFCTDVLGILISRISIGEMKGADIRAVHSMLDTLQVDDLSLRLMEKVRLESATLSPSILNDVLVPYLDQLLHRLRSSNTPLDGPDLRALFTTVLSAYVTRWLGCEPTSATSGRLTDSKLPCNCNECQQLEGYLRADERIGNFPVKQKGRKHLESMLSTNRPRYNGSSELLTTTVAKRGSP